MDLSRLSATDIEAETRVVEAQLKKLAHRRRPTPTERSRALELKKLRLSLKDKLASLSR